LPLARLHRQHHKISGAKDVRVLLSRHFNDAAAALQKSVVAESDKTLADLRRKLGPQIRNALSVSFKEYEHPAANTG
jgi:hypothetical protein